jgi:hypothetical protein
MRHFDQLADDVRDRLFFRHPAAFSRDSERSVLAHALGATLYVPATKDNLAGAVRRQALAGAKSMVIDLEDAISDGVVDAALASTRQTLRDLSEDPPESLVFVRVRSAEHIAELADALGESLSVGSYCPSSRWRVVRTISRRLPPLPSFPRIRSMPCQCWRRRRSCIGNQGSRS